MTQEKLDKIVKKLGALIPLLILSGCAAGNPASKTAEQWCLAEVESEFKFDFEGQNGVAFIRENDAFFLTEDTAPVEGIYAFLVDVLVDQPVGYGVVSYVSWINVRHPVTPDAYVLAKDIVDIGADLVTVAHP